MGIEKYFTKKPVDSEKKPSAATPTRKRKAPETQDDIQSSSVSSKHFSKDSKASAVDPKAFFGSKNTSSKPPAKSKSTTSKVEAAPEPEESKNKQVLRKPVEPKASTSKVAATAKPSSTKAAATARLPSTKAAATARLPSTKAAPVAKATTIKGTKRKAPVKPEKKKHAHIDSEDDTKDDQNASDDDFSDDDNGSDDDDYEEESEDVARRQKKFKKADSPVIVQKATAKAAKTKKDNDQVDETPKKKNYFAMMKSQEPPKALGSRPEPVGAPNCLDGSTFVISGQYETLTREQTKDIIMRYGGRATTAVSGKTSYLCLGRDAGESKVAKAKSLKTKILDEDAFYKLVETSSEKKAVGMVNLASGKPTSAAAKTTIATVATPSQQANQTQLWTEKYKPTEIKDIVGNKEMVRRINEWLQNWQQNFQRGFNNTGDDMNNYSAILLSGAPGIGKTTTASVVTKTNGYEPLEFNASDVRSKKILEESITEMMDNRTMTEYFQPNAKSEKAAEPRLIKGKKVVLIMDEVDGMSGGDRGGAVELAQLIRKSKIPVICICNDSRSTKVAPLLRVCYEAKFRRTPPAQIRSRILTIAFREGLNINPNAVDELVASTQNDIRQVINILSTYRLKESGMDYDQAKKVGKQNQKHSILGLFDIPGELLSSGSWRSKNLTEKYEIYFHDYALSSLMIQENYLKCTPELATSPTGNPAERDCNEMELIAKAAEAIADGDLVDTMIHGTVQHWSLMPIHSIFSCVRPASFARGSIKTKHNFPGWLGQNSKAQKFNRSLSDVQTRMRLKASGDKFEIRQNYIPTLNDRIFGQLREENFEGAIQVMDTYYLERENLDVLSDLTFASAGKHPMQQVPTKSKTAFTRVYNAGSHPVLFQIGGTPIKKSVSGPREDAVGTIFEDDEPIGDDLSEEEEETTVEADLQEIKKYVKEAPKKKKAAASSSSGRATGKKPKPKK